METPVHSIESLLESVETYGKTTLELSKLKALETTTNVVTTLVVKLSVIVILALFALIFNIGIAILLGELLGKSYYGFFIVAVFYLLAGIILHFFLHSWIKRPISESIITQVLQ